MGGTTGRKSNFKCTKQIVQINSALKNWDEKAKRNVILVLLDYLKPRPVELTPLNTRGFNIKPQMNPGSMSNHQPID